ncbi:hypothetical protein EG68_02060 [Paragonimus skrjabini miyazakii]|uniref:A-kinase anchor protein 7-like phosphoesterase domain-containing protein n=1 Tax=Paragonimus skrjabini miyazakii TaxID=59628 RepID=A0A8S9Z9R2_9TREM|nr:hypothetical protein EG68_02060 [Paragonimus skrjabini miyazakii]
MFRILRIILDLINDETIDVDRLFIAYLLNETTVTQEALGDFLHRLESTVRWDKHAMEAYRVLYIRYGSWIVWDRNTNRPLEEVVRQCHQAVRCMAMLDGLSYEGEEWWETLTTDEVDRHSKLHQEDCTEVLRKTFWFKPGEPNFLLCHRVHSASFQDMSATVQARFCDHEPALQDYFYQPAKFHLTLCVFALNSLAEARNCFSLIRHAIQTAPFLIPSDPIRLCGLGSYEGRILFVAAESNYLLGKLVDHVTESVDAAGFVTNVHSKFDPHVTLMKIPQESADDLKIDSRWLKEFRDVEFGEMLITELHFCLRTPGLDGFYRTLGSIKLQELQDSSI